MHEKHSYNNLPKIGAVTLKKENIERPMNNHSVMAARGRKGYLLIQNDEWPKEKRNPGNIFYLGALIIGLKMADWKEKITNFLSSKKS